MIEQNKSPNFPALLQPIWRSDIVELCAPDKHAANEAPRRSRVSLTLIVPRDQGLQLPAASLERPANMS